ncbi:CSLREA domain-containing protein [Pseudomonas mangrovi]|uniref:CSLREA domain-containing protein n=1 Tax=Pseudomonas mangrovi TaxID=2161748 RepID=A0A2T5P6V6_9PSED|nr:CSLREA domain-containing protein [Pseudomonas mangrovi]PTU73470.1 hypothetical protein DBO85_14175 [Pseudomonas mangrovi]
MNTVRELLLCALCLTPAAHALEINVSRTDDRFDGVCDSDCSLREAVALANATPGSHRIRLAAGHYLLEQPAQGLEDEDVRHGDLDLFGQLTIVGAADYPEITLEASRIDGGALDRLFDVHPGARLRLEKLRLENGLHPRQGGAIRNRGRLQVEQVTFLLNRVEGATAHARGGAVANQGALLVRHSLFSENAVRTAGSSWALGGAIHNSGVLVLRDSAAASNHAAHGRDGEGRNSAGADIYNLGLASLARCTLGGYTERGIGGALNNEHHGVVQMSNCTVRTGRTGASLDSSIIGNGTLGLYPDSTPFMRLVHVTVAWSQGGYALDNRGLMQVRNSLVFSGYNPETQRYQGCRSQGPGARFEARGLLLSEGIGNCLADLPPVANETIFTEVLDQVAFHGSIAPSYEPLPGSPAVDAGVGGCASQDQRGAARPQDGDGDGIARCDLGAHERSAR